MDAPVNERKIRFLYALLLGLALLAPTANHAQAKCPWITLATAQGILGGPATLNAEVKDWGNGVCQFSRQDGAAVYELRISVNVMADVAKQFPKHLSQCPAKSTPLTAIGNAAVMCTIQGKRHHYIDQVVGRVRDQAFVISITSNVSNDPSLAQEARREKLHLAAEQVAGILF
jgi:hypothetical protein